MDQLCVTITDNFGFNSQKRNSHFLEINSPKNEKMRQMDTHENDQKFWIHLDTGSRILVLDKW